MKDPYPITDPVASESGTPSLDLRSGYWASGILISIMLLMTAWAWVQIPNDQRLPVHWGMNGKPDRYGGKFEGLLLLPIVATALSLLLAFLPRIEPRKFNLARSRKAYLTIWIAVLVFQTTLHAAMILVALGKSIPMANFVLAGVGLLFMVIGLQIRHTRSNFFMGVRTPWTLSSELSWTKTHKLAGRLFFLAGLIVFASGAFVGINTVGVTLIVASIASAAIIPIIYSYWVWKNDPARSRMGE